MTSVCIFDTGVASENLGDKIIMDAVNKEISKIFPDMMHLNIQTHDRIGGPSRRINSVSKYSFVGGTNLLSSNVLRYRQWKLSFMDAFALKNVVLMGVGWWQYQKTPDLYTKVFLRKLLDNEFIHSVRDTYSLEMLAAAGIKNVVNTGCPTMWSLDARHCSEIPSTKQSSVVFTLTDYNKSIQLDSMLVDSLVGNYSQVYFWPQGTGDIEYYNTYFKRDCIEVLGPNLSSLDDVLDAGHIDYVGTRLHAGIRALQKKRRSVIIGIDNRAKEKSRDFGLKVVDRDHIEGLANVISSNWKTAIRLNSDEIRKWKEQFRV